MHTRRGPSPANLFHPDMVSLDLFNVTRDRNPGAVSLEDAGAGLRPSVDTSLSSVGSWAAKSGSSPPFLPVVHCPWGVTPAHSGQTVQEDKKPVASKGPSLSSGGAECASLRMTERVSTGWAAGASVGWPWAVAGSPGRWLWVCSGW